VAASHAFHPVRWLLPLVRSAAGALARFGTAAFPDMPASGAFQRSFRDRLFCDAPLLRVAYYEPVLTVRAPTDVVFVNLRYGKVLQLDIFVDDHVRVGIDHGEGGFALELHGFGLGIWQ